ncbi:hypothetical protein [Agrobacterium larrymoorei]|uniref:hypothetical protein n=1 Tax=Agrobacterium larrymoorei TaxID=160699 RepID=UPI000482D7D0|nr:hypothetical protein [Agrobacterium larrymoorei]
MACAIRLCQVLPPSLDQGLKFRIYLFQSLLIRPDEFDQVAIDEPVEVVGEPARGLFAEARQSFDMTARADFNRMPKQGLFNPDVGNVQTLQLGPRNVMQFDAARRRLR